MKNFLPFLFAFQLSIPAAFSIFGNPPDLTEIKNQAPNRIEAQAKRYFKNEDLTNAYYYYLALSQVREKLTTDETYRLGKSALFVGDYATAQTYLGMVYTKTTRFPLAHFEYANALKYAGHYEDAIELFNAYIANNTSDLKKTNSYAQIAEHHIETCKEGIRTRQLQVLSADNGKAIAAQVRAVTTTSKHGYRLVEHKDAQGGISLQRINDQDQISAMESSASNPVFRAAAPCVAPDGETVYFMRPEKTATGALEYKIYVSKLNTDGNLVDIQKLSSGVNRVGYSSMYPAVGIDTKGDELLYFTSTLPGGHGGYDLWYATRLNGSEFSQAYHLGMRINSTADEITPFYHQKQEVLYFSSNRAGGAGGYDVYGLKGQQGNWKEDIATPLAEPINSAADDIFYRVDETTNQIFLTTSRLNNKEQTVKFKAPIRAAVPQADMTEK
jgi:OmpA-OmpF porin, OOP family